VVLTIGAYLLFGGENGGPAPEFAATQTTVRPPTPANGSGTSDAEAEPETPPAADAPSDGSWTIVEGAVTLECPGLPLAIPPSPSEGALFGDVEVVDDGARVLVSSTEPGRSGLELLRVDNGDGPPKYEAAIPVAEMMGDQLPPEAEASGEFRFTLIFDTPTSAQSELSGELTMLGYTCTWDRAGTATYSGP